MEVTRDPDDSTVLTGQVQRVADLIVAGRTPLQAAAEAGMSQRILGRMSEEVKARVHAILDTYTMEDAVAQALVRARLHEFMLSEDPEVAMPAIKEVKKLHGMDKPVRIDLSVPRPPGADDLEAE